MSNAIVLYASNYGVTGDGHTDDTVAMNRAATASMALDQAVLLVLPSGTIKVTDTIIFANPGSTGMTMPVVLGAGSAATIIDGHMPGDQPIFKFRGIPAVGMGAPGGDSFGFNGGMIGFTIDGTNATGANVVGLEIMGWVRAVNRDVIVQNVSSHGITPTCDFVWSGNPDLSACNGHTWFGCQIFQCGGNGWYDPNSQGAPQMLFENCQISSTYLSCFLINSSNVCFNICSVGDAGWWHSSDTTVNHVAYAIEFQQSTRAFVQSCEFFECMTGIIAFGQADCNFVQGNRFIIANNHVGSTILRPPICVDFGYKSSSDIAIGNVIDGNFHRIDPNTVISPTVTLYNANIHSGGNLQGNFIRQRYGPYTPSVTVVAQAGWDTNFGSFMFNNVVDVQIIVAGIQSLLEGTPPPSMQAYVLAGTSVVGTSTYTNIPGNTLYGLFANSNWLWQPNYNLTTGEFNPPSDGLYRVTFSVQINTNGVAADTPKFRILGGLSGEFWEFYAPPFSGSPAKIGWSFSAIIQGVPGQVLSAQAFFTQGGMTYIDSSFVMFEAVST